MEKEKNGLIQNVKRAFNLLLHGDFLEFCSSSESLSKVYNKLSLLSVFALFSIGIVFLKIFSSSIGISVGLMFADEPTGNLDQSASNEIFFISNFFNSRFILFFKNIINHITIRNENSDF